MKVETIFFDIDTQVDFLDPAGGLYVPDSDKILPNVKRLLEYASRRNITTISSMDKHIINDPEFELYPPHCIEGTAGQRRYFDDLPRMPRRVWSPDAPVTEGDLKIEPGLHYITQKRTLFVFANPWLAAMHAQGAFRQTQNIVFGVCADICVRIGVLDLRRVGAAVHLVRDAIMGIIPEDTERALMAMMEAGVRLVTTDDVVGDVGGWYH